MKLAKHEEILFALLRYAVNGVPLQESVFMNSTDEDWVRCHALAAEQGVMAVAWDAVTALPYELQPPKPLKIRWALAVEKYTETYRRYCKTIKELSDFYAAHGIATVQLKGVGLSSYYPVPERRQGGDIDIYTYSSDKSVMDDEEANELADKLMRDKGIDVDLHSYKHSFFYYNGIPVENHKFFTDVEHYTAAAEADMILHENFTPQKAVMDGKYEIMVPSPGFNSLFVIIHALQHFTLGLCLHHLCDCALVIKKAGLELPLQIRNSHFTGAVKALAQICREYLGTDIPKEEGFEELCDTIMGEILYPKFRKGEIPHNPIGIFWYKTRRFAYSSRLRAKVWNISVARAVWQSVVSHVKNPETIFSRGE